MAKQHLFGLLLVIGLSLDVSARPSNNEPTVTENVNMDESTMIDHENVKKEKTIVYNPMYSKVPNESIREILEKIKEINDGLKKPNSRQPIRWNNPTPNDDAYTLDQDTLQKLQQAIASGKLQSYYDHSRQLKNNEIHNEYAELFRKSRDMQLLGMNAGLQVMPVPYIMNMPIMVIPNMNNIYGGMINNRLNSIDTPSYQTKQGFSESPFQIQWPFASFFPVHIKDPFLSIISGAGLNNWIEFGQSADVCRKQKIANVDVNDFENDQNALLKTLKNYSSRQKRSVNKRTVAQQSTKQDIDESQKKSIYITRPTRTPDRKPTKTVPATPKPQSIKTVVDSEEGDLRFPFGDFGFFGNKKPVAPSPGFFINRLKVRRGGVAIAGPGGVATAGRGGTAIVGPGGLAYTQPGGLAVAGPAARIVALSSDADLSSVVSRLQAQAATDDSTAGLVGGTSDVTIRERKNMAGLLTNTSTTV